MALIETATGLVPAEQRNISRAPRPSLAVPGRTAVSASNSTSKAVSSSRLTSRQSRLENHAPRCGSTSEGSAKTFSCRCGGSGNNADKDCYSQVTYSDPVLVVFQAFIALFQAERVQFAKLLI